MNTPARVAVIVLARSGSQRMPGKMLHPFGQGTVLSTVMERCAAMDGAHEVVLATTVGRDDDALSMEAESWGVRVVRGSEDDVVARMMQAVGELEQTPDVIVRACADNPLVMPTVVDAAIDELLQSGCDLITPFECATLPFGYGLVVMTRECLQRIDREAGEAVYREHVENYCLEHPERFHLRYQVAPEGLAWPELCLTLDYAVDLQRLHTLAEELEGLALWEQPRALLEHLRGARVWVQGSSAGLPELHDLVLAVEAPIGARAPRGVVVVDRFEVGGESRFGLRYADPRPAGFPSGPLYLDTSSDADDSPEEFLARVAPLALPLLLAAPARPIDLLEAAAPPSDKRLHAAKRRGFNSPGEETFPAWVVLEHAATCPSLLEELLRELEGHEDTELCLPGGSAEELARAIECLGDQRVHATAAAPDPFRVLTIDDDGQLQVAGASWPLADCSIASFWTSSDARAARAAALNREAAP